jgi:hypothetical protein
LDDIALIMKYDHQRVFELKGNQQCQDHAEEPPNLSPDQRVQRMMKSAGLEIDTGARDIVFVLDQLTRLVDGNPNAFVLRKRLDLNRVAAIGHSAGGANATLACQMDPRFKACLSLDGQMPPVAVFPENPAGKWFTQPVLLLEVDHNGRWMARLWDPASSTPHRQYANPSDRQPSLSRPPWREFPGNVASVPEQEVIQFMVDGISMRGRPAEQYRTWLEIL